MSEGRRFNSWTSAAEHTHPASGGAVCSFHRCVCMCVCACACATSLQPKGLLLTVGQDRTCPPLLTVISRVGSSLAAATYLSVSSQPRRVSREGVTRSCISDSADSSYLPKQRNNAVPAAVKTVIFCLRARCLFLRDRAPLSRLKKKKKNRRGYGLSQHNLYGTLVGGC